MMITQFFMKFLDDSSRNNIYRILLLHLSTEDLYKVVYNEVNNITQVYLEIFKIFPSITRNNIDFLLTIFPIEVLDKIIYHEVSDFMFLKYIIYPFVELCFILMFPIIYMYMVYYIDTLLWNMITWSHERTVKDNIDARYEIMKINVHTEGIHRLPRDVRKYMCENYIKHDSVSTDYFTNRIYIFVGSSLFNSLSSIISIIYFIKNFDHIPMIMGVLLFRLLRKLEN